MKPLGTGADNTVDATSSGQAAAGPFDRALAALQTDLDPSDRSWVFVACDQLSDRIGPLAALPARHAGLVLVESRRRAERRPYHIQRIAIEWANARHFALEQARRGVMVLYLVTDGSIAETLAAQTTQLGCLNAAEPAERELQSELAPLVAEGRLELVPHGGWLAAPVDLTAARQQCAWRMDAFYRQVRRRTGVLMERGKPMGGRFSFDPENRLPWPGTPPAPQPPTCQPDPVTVEVLDLVRAGYFHHPGVLDGSALPATAADAQRLWNWAQAACLPHFGPFEDAMSWRSAGLFHTRVSALVNLHRLLPSQVVADVAAMDLPLASQEGFVRQVLGWREFVRLVHLATDGFRVLPEGEPAVAETPGDGGFARWSGRPWVSSHHVGDPDGGACPSFLGCHRPLPPCYWGVRSGLACLDTVVEAVWREGWSHHITRLMVLANLATLLDVDPRQLTDWFWVAYTDAYDWVVEPNVLAMGTFAVGPLMTTKPYVAGAAYIHRMSDYCSQCAFDPRRNCPITRLYWAFLDRHRDRLVGNPRMGMMFRALARRPPAATLEDRRVFTLAGELLDRGDALSPERLGG